LALVFGSLASALSYPPAASARESSNGLYSLFDRLAADVAEAADGSLIINGPGSVERRALDGSISKLAGNGGVMGILVSKDGSILVADGRTEQIHRLQTDGTETVVAGTGRKGFAGDGGPATGAELTLSEARGAIAMTELADGALLFDDGGNRRVRRIRTDGIIETVAGSGPSYGVRSFAPDDVTRGDGGPAASARFGDVGDLLATADGGFLVADSVDRRVRKVWPDGTITTFAGGGTRRGDGGPATRALLSGPSGLVALADGRVAFNDGDYLSIRAVGADGIVRPFLDRAAFSTRAGRLGDFAGRLPEGGVLAATAEQGLILGGNRRVYYLAPNGTARTLIALRDTRATGRTVTVDLEATQPGIARVELLRGRRVVATTTSAIAAGRQSLTVRGTFAPVAHGVHVSLTSATGATAADYVRLFPVTSIRPLLRLIHENLRLIGMYVNSDASYAFDGVPPSACRHQSRRRVDCALLDQRPDTKPSCDGVFSFTVARSGILWVRDYDCARPERATFQRHPQWNTCATTLSAWSRAGLDLRACRGGAN
jgi:hypothetical protein